MRLPAVLLRLALVCAFALPLQVSAQWLPGKGPQRPAGPVGAGPMGPSARPMTPPVAPNTPGKLLVQLILGPITTIAGPGQAPATPLVRGARIEVTDSSGKALAKGVTNAQGVWEQTMPPGGGRIWVRTCPGSGGQLPPAIGYTVRPGGGMGVTIACKSRP